MGEKTDRRARERETEREDVVLIISTRIILGNLHSLSSLRFASCLCSFSSSSSHQLAFHASVRIAFQYRFATVEQKRNCESNLTAFLPNSIPLQCSLLSQ